MTVKKTTRIEAGFRVFLLVAIGLTSAPAIWAGGGRPAAQEPPAPSARTHWVQHRKHEVTGEVESVTVSRLTLACRVEGKKEEVSFALDPETQREGALKTGAEATVKFRVENSRKIATFVTAKENASTPRRTERPGR